MFSIRCSLLTLGVCLVSVTTAQGQNRGSEPKPAPATAPAGSRGDPDKFFKGLSKGKDVLIRAEMDPAVQHLFDKFASKTGASSGQITIDQFRRVWNDGKKEGAGMQPAAKTETVDVVTPIKGRPGRNGNGNGKPATLPDQFAITTADSSFRTADHNHDGVLDYEEMPDDLQETLDTWDGNDNGFIDLEEHRRYFSARMQQRLGEREENGIATPWSNREGDDMPSGALGRDGQKKPLVYNTGNLPQHIPSWFRDLDKNGDAQVSLFEWRQSKDKSINDFARYDPNNDGFITVEDILRGNGRSSSGAGEVRRPRNEGIARAVTVPNANGNGGDRRMTGWPGGGNFDWRNMNKPGGDGRNMRRGGGEGGDRPNFNRPGGNRERGNNADKRPKDREP